MINKLIFEIEIPILIKEDKKNYILEIPDFIFIDNQKLREVRVKW